MSSTVQPETLDAPEVAPTTKRRTPRRWQLVLGAVAFTGLAAFTMASCTPQEVARDAIASYWGAGNVNCAMRVVERESGYNPEAVNPYSGAIGLFQIHPTHTTWIRNKWGYSFSELTDPYKNARVAAGLSTEAYRMWGDGWAPWRIGGGAIRGGGCPA